MVAFALKFRDFRERDGSNDFTADYPTASGLGQGRRDGARNVDAHSVRRTAPSRGAPSATPTTRPYAADYGARQRGVPAVDRLKPGGLAEQGALLRSFGA